MTNAVPTTRLSLTYSDASSELSSMGINSNQFIDNAAFIVARSELEDAIDAVTDGTLIKREASLPTVVDTKFNGAGQRELKLLIEYFDDVSFKNYSQEVPTAKLGLVTQPNSDYLDILDGGVNQALVTKYEAFAISPEGNALTVTGVKYIGRNI